jgi:hypothetical protein
MIALAGIATLIFVGVGTTVGVRLLLLAYRTRGLPETLLGSGLFLIVAVGYPLLLVAHEMGGTSPTVRGLASMAATSMAIGWMCVWQFTWRVFRREMTSARIFTWAAVAALGFCAAWRVRILLFDAVPPMTPTDTPSLGIQVLALSVYVWTALESFSYWARLRKRLALGLADPVVTNRFFLWGLTSSLSFMSLISPALASFAGVDPYNDPLILLLTAVTGLGCSITLSLAFLPPKAYLRLFVSEAG